MVLAAIGMGRNMWICTCIDVLTSYHFHYLSYSHMELNTNYRTANTPNSQFSPAPAVLAYDSRRPIASA